MNNDDYDDIINLKHHVSECHQHMTMYQRAAQFAPFAALTGHEEVIADTAKLNVDEFNMTHTDDAPELNIAPRSEDNNEFL